MAVARLHGLRHQRWNWFVSFGSREFSVSGLQLGKTAPKLMLEGLGLPYDSHSPPPLKRRGRKWWRKCFADTPQCLDGRAQKINSKLPDWISVKSKEAFWLESVSTAPSVRKKLPSILSQGRHVQTLPGASYRRTVVISHEDIRELCLNSRPENALHIFEQRGIDLSAYAYVCLLRRSSNIKNIAEGKLVHAHMVKSWFVPSKFVLNALLSMYIKCGSLMDARQVFDQMRERDMFTWTMMVTGYAKLGHPEQAYELYEQMHRERVPVDKVAFTTVLSVCARLRSLEKGKKVHCDIINAGILPDRMLANTLIDMYAKCGDIKQGHKVFKEMSEHDVVSWNIMISGAAQNDCFVEALKFLEAMRETGLKPDKVTYVTLLNACSSLEHGRAFYSDIVRAGFELDVWVGNALVNMFSKCGSLEDALQIFEDLPQRNVVSWTSMIAACAQFGETDKALELYEKMCEEGIAADRLAFTTVLRVCATLGDLKKGKEVHEQIIQSGIVSDLIMESTLIDMYAKCGRVQDTHQLLGNMKA